MIPVKQPIGETYVQSIGFDALVKLLKDGE